MTCIEWSRDGRRVLSADDAGVVAVTDISGYGARDDGVPETFSATESASESSSREPPGVPSTLDRITEASSSSASDALKKSGAPSVVRPMTVEELLTTAAITSVLDVGSRVVQGSFSPDGETALVSTTEAAVLLGVRSGLHPRVGSKPREGAYGGCFHRGAARAAVRLGLVDPAEAAGRSSDDDDGISGSTKSDAGRARWMLAARPGRRLWVAEARVDSDGVPISRVVSTLRPEMIPPTDAPGSPAYARTPVASSEGSAAPKTQKPRRWEFGEIRALGEFCAVSVSARAIAVAELAGASLLAWFPTGDAAPPDAAGVSAGVASFAVPEASFSRAAREKDGAGNDGAPGPRVAAAFFLAAPERGGGVWCLEAPSDARALTCAVADAAETPAEVSRAVRLATTLEVAETRLVEEARRMAAAAREGADGELLGVDAAAAAADADADPDPSEEALGELRDALDAYEPVFARLVAARGGVAPPPRPGKRRDEPEGSFGGTGERSGDAGGSSSEGAKASGTRARGTADAAAAEGEATRGEATRGEATRGEAMIPPVIPPATASAPSAAYPEASASTNFFFYNPHKADGRGSRPDPSGPPRRARAARSCRRGGSRRQVPGPVEEG